MNLPFLHKTCLPQYVYFHYPVCQHVCSYCDFVTFSAATLKKKQPQFEKQWLTTLRNHLSCWWEREPGGLELKTLYLGGGTPSLLSVEALKELCDFLKTKYDFSGLKEFTIECNPETISKDYWKHLRNLGVTRPSLGIQSVRSEHLRRLERLATYEHIDAAVAGLRHTFDNFSLDFMIGIPDQTLEQVCEDVEKILAWDPPHLSVYILTIDSDHIWLRKPFMKNRLADSEAVAEMYLKVCEILSKAGYNHYEVSNFAQPGYESVHNKNYWSAESDYLGIGPGAHGYLKSKDDSLGRVRYSCHGELKKWFSSPTGVDWFEELTAEQQRLERLYLQLRTRRPIDLKELKRNYVEAYAKENLVQRDEKDRVVVTEKGWLVLEELATQMI